MKVFDSIIVLTPVGYSIFCYGICKPLFGPVPLCAIERLDSPPLRICNHVPPELDLALLACDLRSDS
ncbi:hypothetical protein J8J17_26410, partial [Mycobacterium tuberculosis]|nr:hypothetical protein [Mycobacterium tuberculosis]